VALPSKVKKLLALVKNVHQDVLVVTTLDGLDEVLGGKPKLVTRGKGRREGPAAAAVLRQ
jgi:hypothetical protein